MRLESRIEEAQKQTVERKDEHRRCEKQVEDLQQKLADVEATARKNLVELDKFCEATESRLQQEVDELRGLLKDAKQAEKNYRILYEESRKCEEQLEDELRDARKALRRSEEAADFREASLRKEVRDQAEQLNTLAAEVRAQNASRQRDHLRDHSEPHTPLHNGDRLDGRAIVPLRLQTQQYSPPPNAFELESPSASRAVATESPGREASSKRRHSSSRSSRASGSKSPEEPKRSPRRKELKSEKNSEPKLVRSRAIRTLVSTMT